MELASWLNDGLCCGRAITSRAAVGPATQSKVFDDEAPDVTDDTDHASRDLRTKTIAAAVQTKTTPVGSRSWLGAPRSVSLRDDQSHPFHPDDRR